MPEIDDKSQYDHGERREVEPVWFEVLHELCVRKLKSHQRRGATYEEEKTCDLDQAIIGRKFEMKRIPKRRP